MTEDEIKNGRHLGDGVYISFDGYQLWLAANHHENRVIAIELGIVDLIIDYRKELREFYKR